MARMALLLAAAALVALAPEGARGAFGHAKVAEHFDAEISKHFLSSTKKSYALRKSRKENKPLMVMLTRRGCGASRRTSAATRRRARRSRRSTRRCARRWRTARRGWRRAARAP